MGKIIEAKPREAIDEKYQWKLDAIFKTDDDFREALDKFKQKMDDADQYIGTLDQGPDQVIKALETILTISRELETLYVYAHLKHDQNTQNNYYLGLQSQMQSLAAQAGQKMAWFEPEVIHLDQKILDQLLADEEYGHFFEELLATKDHVLAPEQEHLLAGASEVFDNASQTFAIFNNSDLKFGEVKDTDGQPIKLTHGTYGVLLENKDRDVRENAFKTLYAQYDNYINTIAQMMSGNIKHHNFIANTRHYNSAREAALAQNNIPVSVYDTLVETVSKHTSLLHEYVGLRKDMLNLDTLEMWDMYTPLTGEAPLSFTFDEAKDIVFKALAPLGEQYLNDLKQAFSDGWIDVYENIGKRSGAYSSGAYDTMPYVLLNWQDSLNDLYTLVHELGHSMHSYYSQKNQPYVYGDYSIFVAEIASTTNENLLTDYLLKNVQDKDTQIYILNHYLDGFKGTIFRQTQFAEFEQFMHEADAKGQPLNAEFLSNAYYDLNRKYYGPAVGEDRTIQYEWSRIPHFYMNYYVYQYATGFSAANSLAKHIASGDIEARDRYLIFLQSGSSDYPIEVMKKAGVDMTNSTYIEEAMDQFTERLAELKDRLNQ